MMEHRRLAWEQLGCRRKMPETAGKERFVRDDWSLSEGVSCWMQPRWMEETTGTGQLRPGGVNAHGGLGVGGEVAAGQAPGDGLREALGARWAAAGVGSVCGTPDMAPKLW